MIKSEKASLYSCDYIFGHLPDIDTKAIEKMVLENHKKKRMMHEDPNNIRGEDIRIDYDENIQKLKNQLCNEYKSNTGMNIQLCCDANSKIHKDRNESYWAIVHGRNGEKWAREEGRSGRCDGAKARQVRRGD